MTNSNVVIPNEVRELLKVSTTLEREYPLTCTKVSSRRSFITLGLTIALLLTTTASGFAQSITPEIISTGGGDTSTANVSLSWTIGEPLSETISSTSTKITQGFHQNHLEIVSIEEHKEFGYEIKVYPNPSTDFINVELTFIGKFSTTGNTEFKIMLIDNLGKILMSEVIKNKLEYMIPMQDYAAGQYILKITGTEGNLYKSVQITKLK